mgnify:CR=1 FL=1
MALDADSTYQEARRQYLNNAGYTRTKSVSEAELFEEAIRHLLIHIPAKAQHGGHESLDFDPEVLLKQLDDVREWLTMNDTTIDGAVVHADFGCFRT